MKRKFIFTILLTCCLLAVLNSSCEKEIDFNNKYKNPKLVLYSLLSTNDSIEIKLSRSMNIIDNANIITINDASIEIYEDGQLLPVPVTAKGKGLYTVPYIPKEGKKYRIVASNEGLKTIESEVVMPKKPVIREIPINVRTSEEIMNEKTINFSLNFDDDPNEDNYYLLKFEYIWPAEHQDYYQRFNDYYYYASIDFSDRVSARTSGFFNGRQVYFSDEYFNGKNYTFNFSTTNYGMYDIFRHYGYSEVEEDDSVEPFPGYELKLVVHFATISKDFYQFLKSYDDHSEAEDMPLSEPVMVKNNITNGLGILGAKSVTTDTLTYYVENPFIDEN